MRQRHHAASALHAGGSAQPHRAADRSVAVRTGLATLSGEGVMTLRARSAAERAFWVRAESGTDTWAVLDSVVSVFDLEKGPEVRHGEATEWNVRQVGDVRREEPHAVGPIGCAHVGAEVGFGIAARAW